MKSYEILLLYVKKKLLEILIFIQELNIAQQDLNNALT